MRTLQATRGRFGELELDPNADRMLPRVAGLERQHQRGSNPEGRGERQVVDQQLASRYRTARTTDRIAGRVDSSAASGELRQIMTDLGSAAAELGRTTNTISAMATRLAGSQGHLDRFS